MSANIMWRKVPAGLAEELVPDAWDLLQEPADLAVLGVAGTGLQGHGPLGRDDDLGLTVSRGGRIAVGVVGKSREEVVLWGLAGRGATRDSERNSQRTERKGR